MYGQKVLDYNDVQEILGIDEYVPTQQELEQIFEHFDVHNEKSIAKLDSHEDDFDHFAITKDGPLTRSRTAHTSHQTKPSVIPVPNSDPEFPISPEFMGKRISKEFIDPDTGLLRPYTGIVKEFNSKTGKYRIHYPEDDDEEWMTSRKLTSFLDSAPSQSLNQPTDSTPVSIPPVVSDLDNQYHNWTADDQATIFALICAEAKQVGASLRRMIPA